MRLGLSQIMALAVLVTTSPDAHAQRRHSAFCTEPADYIGPTARQECKGDEECIAKSEEAQRKDHETYCKADDPQIFSVFGLPDALDIEGDVLRVFWEGKRQPQLVLSLWKEAGEPKLRLEFTDGLGTYGYGDVVFNEIAPVSEEEFANVVNDIDSGFFDLRSWSWGYPPLVYEGRVRICLHAPGYVVEGKIGDSLNYISRHCDERYRSDFRFARGILRLAINKFAETLPKLLDEEFLPYHLEDEAG